MSGFPEDWTDLDGVEGGLTEAEIEAYLRRRAVHLREIARKRLARGLVSDPSRTDVDCDRRMRLRACAAQLHDRHVNGLASAEERRRLLVASLMLHRLSPRPLLRVPRHVRKQLERPDVEACECVDLFPMSEAEPVADKDCGDALTTPEAERPVDNVGNGNDSSASSGVA